MNVAVKWVGSAAAIFVICVAIYLGAVFSVYLIGWIVELIGIIFD
jgi:hypothetical protein